MIKGWVNKNNYINKQTNRACRGQYIYIYIHTHTHISSKVLRRVQCFIWINFFWSTQVDAFLKVVFSSCTEYFKPNGSLQVAWALEQKHNPRQILQREQFTWSWMTDLCRLYHSQSTDKTQHKHYQQKRNMRTDAFDLIAHFFGGSKPSTASYSSITCWRVVFLLFS